MTGPYADAITAAGRGWSVFPLKHGSKAGFLQSSWKAASTADVAEVAAEFIGRTLNYGIDTGASGLVVLDEDGPGAMAELCQRGGIAVPSTYTVATGKGRHFYFTARPGQRVGNGAAIDGLALDVRAAGGFVLGAGSVHPNGATYTAENDLDPVPLPVELLAKLSPRGDTSSTGDTFVSADPFAPGFVLPMRITAGTADGTPGRDATIYSYACSLQANGVPYTPALRLMELDAFPRVEQKPGDPFTLATALAKVHAAYQQYGDGSVPPVPDWPDLVPLKPMAVVVPFPVHALAPSWLRTYVTAEATATQTPPDLAAMLVLAAISSVAAGTVRIEVRPGWVEPVNIYAAVALPPGARKSAVFSDVTRPLVDFDRAEVVRMRARILEDTTARKVAERAREHAEAAAGKAAPAEQQKLLADATAAAMRAASLTVAAQPRLLADDITPEALSTLLAESPYDRVSVLSPEGGVFEMMAGRYQNGPNLDVYLKGHAGDEIRIDRKSRDPEFVHRPAITLGLAIQPEVLRTLDDRPGFRGRGLLARFLYALPVNTVGTRTVCPPPVSDEVKDTYVSTITGMAATLRARADERQYAAGEHGDATVTLRLGDEAQALFRAFETQLEPRLHPVTGDLAPITDWASKLAGAVARIAALLHIVSLPGDLDAAPSIWSATMTSAIEIGNYLITHAQAAFDLMGNSDPAIADARMMVDVISKKSWSTFGRRDLFRAMQSNRFAKATAVDPGLAVLESHGYIRARPQQPVGPGGGRHGGAQFDVHPNIGVTP